MVEATFEDLAMTTVLGGNLTQLDGDVVLSTTLLKDSRCGQAWEQRIIRKILGVNRRSSTPPRRTVREWR
jgi:hypothetical protein